MSLGRIVLMVKGDDRLFIRRTWLTKIFVCGDVLAFMTQSTGASMLASAKDQDGVDAGNNIIIAGLWIQVAFFGLFVVASAVFHMRLAKGPTQASRSRPWNKHLISLYIVSGLILVRSVMRCIEYMQGYNGYICKSRAVEFEVYALTILPVSHEAFLYVFDAAVMLFAVVTMNAIHPGEVARYVREDARTAKEGSAVNYTSDVELV
jgi:hypothetical protein